jgi:hypothetical protein
MSREPDHKEMQALAQGVVTPGLVVECVVFDQADRPKRRHLLPLAGLLAPLSGKVSGLAADAS